MNLGSVTAKLKKNGTKIITKHKKQRIGLNENEEEVLQELQRKHPGLDVNVFKMSRFPPNFWESSKNHRVYLDYLYLKLNYKSWEDWYKVTNAIALKHRGRGMIDKYKSIFRAVVAIYNEYKWEEEESINFPRAKSPKYWKERENQIKYFDDLFYKMKYTKFEEWYSLHFDEVSKKHKGYMILQQFGSVFFALKSIYPNYPWDISKSSNRFKFSHLNQTNLLISLQKLFRIQRTEDWYRISKQILHDHQYLNILQSMGGLNKLLRKLHPKVDWDFAKFSEKTKKSVQRWLFIVISNIFPTYHILEGYYYPSLRFPMGKWISFDIYIPEANTAIEYDGEQHFEDVHMSLGFLEITQNCDQLKRVIAEENLIRLMKIPFWWDRSQSSLLPHLTIVR